jgi:hypothetical protein
MLLLTGWWVDAAQFAMLLPLIANVVQPVAQNLQFKRTENEKKRKMIPNCIMKRMSQQMMHQRMHEI